MHTLQEQGDPIEKRNYPLFIETRFPSYENFWMREVVPVTNRAGPTLFKSEAELQQAGKTRLNCYFAQLHYSVQFHLGVAYGFVLIEDAQMEYTKLMQAMTSLLAATDVAFELLRWWTLSPDQQVGLLKECSSQSAEKKLPLFCCLEERARAESFSLAWRKDPEHHASDLDAIRKYRDKMVHRGVRSVWVNQNVSWFPRVGTEDKYCEWGTQADPVDFALASGILWPSWKKTVEYLESQWCEVLLK